MGVGMVGRMWRVREGGVESIGGDGEGCWRV